MEYTTLGDTGLEISRIGLGCMSFGSSDYRDWVLGPDESREIIERAIEHGINFFDTANIYSYGDSERVLGDVLDDYDRDRAVVASKCYFQMDETNPNSGGLSRKAIEQELSNSLDRLGLETIDLYQIHRWDYQTPIAETLRTLTDMVRDGSVRYLGASSMWAYQFATALHASERLGLERFVSMQNHYNLAYREEEREMLPFCEQAGVGVIPWSPLARGFLTRPYADLTRTTRGQSDVYGGQQHDWSSRVPYEQSNGQEINQRLQEIATQKDASMAQIAIAWLLHQDPIDAPIVGTTSVEHLDEAVAALDISLSPEEQSYLEAPYEPVEPSGHDRDRD